MTSKIAYLMSWFPARTETFILYEILELERRGLSVEIYPVLGKKGGEPHPEAIPLIGRTNYRSYLSAAVLRANWYWLRTSPLRYLGVFLACLFGNLRSPTFLAKMLVVFPKAALIAKELQDKGVQRVHAHWATHPTLAAYVIKGLTGIPYSFTAHAHDLYVDRTMLRQKLQAAEQVLTISDFNKKLIRGWYGEEAAKKVSVVRCGIDSSVFRPKSVDGRRNTLFTAVCIASLRDYKGHRYLIDACKQLKARGRTFKVLLIGDGEDRLQIAEQIAQAGLVQEIQLMGHQPRHRVSELLRDADLAVQPSIVTADGKMEGIPVALMEAMASEVPVVATNISGISELVRDGVTGLLVPEKDASALADAIERVMTNGSASRKLAQAGRELVLREFDLKRNAARLFTMLTGRTAVEPVAAAAPRTAARQKQHSHPASRAEA